MSDDSRSRLEELLDHEIEAARALESALATERSALTGSSPAAVEDCAARKVELLGTIEKMEAERRSLAAAADQPLPGSGLPRDGQVATSVAERWDLLMSLMKDCRSSNEINGYIINTRRGQIQKLLGVVRGAASPLTYNPQGKAFAKAQRALAKA
jgi:flagellar biosynthesis/type III secretory pathway chaperone